MNGKQKRSYPAASLPLSLSAVSAYLDSSVIGNTIAVVQSLDSTNAYIKKCISALDDGFTIISEKQLAGRGRLGRTFVSPNGGLYMSTLLIGHGFVENPAALTVRAAVAVKNAIKELSGIENIGIKWVNDIYCGDKKVCGILAESVVRRGLCDFSILGIGVNVTTSANDLSEVEGNVAGSLCEFADIEFSRNELAAKILENLEKVLFETNKERIEAILDDYRESSVIVGKEVYVIKDGGTVKARVLGIDETASLYVEYSDGKTEMLRTGEVSTKLIGGEND